MKMSCFIGQANRIKRFLVACLMLLFAASLASCARQHGIRILHINDFHGFEEAYKPYGSEDARGGLAYLAARAEALRAEKPTLFLAAGDIIQGSNWANMFQGKSSIEAMNAMKLDAMVVGNHEFDFGQTVLTERIKEANFPVLGANVLGLSALKPYIIKELDGLSIAVIGVVTGDAPVSTHPKNVSGLQFLSPVDTVEKYVRQLRGKSDLVIVLSHIGFGADIDLAKKVEGIDVIVGGHTHTKVAKPAVVGKTLVVQAFEHGKVLGVLDLTVKKGGIARADGWLEPVAPVGQQSKIVDAIVDKYQGKVDSFFNQTIGESLADLDGVHVRRQETNLGNLVTDIMRKASGADAAIINGGTIRTSIRKGPVKAGDVYAALPADNYIVAVRLTGKQIRVTLEHGVSAIDEDEGRFPQVSGLAFAYDRFAPKGSRVKEVFIGGSPLAADREYSIATNDFLAAGGDGYKAFGEAVKSSGASTVVNDVTKWDNLVYSDSGRWLRDVVIDFIKAEKQISPTVEGRIRETKGQ